MSEEAVWPASVIAKLGRAPRVGDWVTYCCEQDLEQVRDQEHLAELLEHDSEEFGPYTFWLTREPALAELQP